MVKYKIEGVNLEEIFGNEPLDVVLMFSKTIVGEKPNYRVCISKNDGTASFAFSNEIRYLNVFFDGNTRIIGFNGKTYHEPIIELHDGFGYLIGAEKMVVDDTNDEFKNPKLNIKITYPTLDDIFKNQEIFDSAISYGRDNWGVNDFLNHVTKDRCLDLNYFFEGFYFSDLYEVEEIEDPLQQYRKFSFWLADKNGNILFKNEKNIITDFERAYNACSMIAEGFINSNLYKEVKMYVTYNDNGVEKLVTSCPKTC